MQAMPVQDDRVGVTLPRLGLGTYGQGGPATLDGIRTALELGYRHIDTAQAYGTEILVGEALGDSGLPRDQVFITTKVSDINLAKKDFLPSLKRSQDQIGVNVLDLTLIHWPSFRDAVPFEVYIDELAEAKARGLTRAIGVSNFPCALVDRAVARLGAGQVLTNQVELHPYLQNRRVRASARHHGFTVTAYMPLAGGRVIHDATIKRVAARHDESPATVTLAWLLQRGMAVIPSSDRRDHLEANLRATRLRLGEIELAELDALDRAERLIQPAKSPAWD